MKRLLLSLFLLIPLIVFAEDGIVVPQWEDYVPKVFVNVKEPKGLGKLNVSAMYWYQRRVSFEKDVEECGLKTEYDEKSDCYEKVKIKQYKENTDYNARMKAQENNASAYPPMLDRTDTMLPINGYFDAFTRYQPNEIK